MLLKQLSVLLSLPSAILTFVILPEAQVFSAPSRLRESTPLAPKYASHPQTQDSHAEDVDEHRFLPKLSDIPPVLENYVVDEEWVKITRISPKLVTRPVTDGANSEGDDPLPVIFWHGLGDSADADGLKEIAELVDKAHPGTYTYIISLTGSAGSADRQASFFGNVTEQVDAVCHKLASDKILRTAPGIDAVGFSQGGIFLRGYVERCGGWAPKVRSLITFGSPHNGIAEFQKCSSPNDWLCQSANALLKSGTVWSSFIQSRLVPAQYYRDTNDFENYLEHSNFLADINNEREVKNATYAENLAALEKLVMVVFDNDTTVIPKESAWFAEVNATSEVITELRDRPIYKEDWVGLKKLDEKKGLSFVHAVGRHMELSDKDLTKLFGTYFGSAGKKFDDSATAGETVGRWKSDL